MGGQEGTSKELGAAVSSQPQTWRGICEFVAVGEGRCGMLPWGRTQRRRADAGPRLGVLAVVHHSAGAKGVSVVTTNKRLGPRPRPFSKTGV